MCTLIFSNTFSEPANISLVYLSTPRTAGNLQVPCVLVAFPAECMYLICTGTHYGSSADARFQ